MISFMSRVRMLRSDEYGIALPVVVGLGLVMLVLVGSGMSITAGSLNKSSSDEDWNGALAAAYAGVEEYQSRLANDATYQKYGNSAATFTSGSTVTLPTGTNANLAFGVGAAGTWAPVVSADSAISSIASYRYEIDNSDYQDKGILHLRSTGRVGTVTRSVVADLKQEGFIDYLYFTNYEVQDPAYSGSTSAIDPVTNKSVCERYSYATSPARPSACGAPQFTPIDDFHGPVRSNDGMIICGSTFEDAVTTSAPNAAFTVPSGCSAADFQVGGKPVYGPTIGMPPTNSEMKKETRNDLPADVPRPGCLYTGPTVITLIGDGTMNVISPWTKKTRTAAPGTAAGGTAPTSCGTPGTAAGSLGSPGGATIPILDLNLLFVQNVPAEATADPNAPATGVLPSGITCTNASGSAPAGWTFKNTSTNAIVARYPMANEVTPTGASGLVHYGCRNGDLFVKGTLSGQTTMAAENYVYVTGDVLYKDKQADMLGLVGQKAVLVYNPRNSSNAALLTGSNREIDAALLSVGATFQVQNFDATPNRGTLTVFGTIAQKFRGTVVTFSGSSVVTGYAKNYQYDKRFRNTAPPKFLTPVSTTYGVTQYATVPAAFTANGAAVAGQ